MATTRKKHKTVSDYMAEGCSRELAEWAVKRDRAARARERRKVQAARAGYAPRRATRG